MKFSEYLKDNTYPGRGLAIGRSADGRLAILCYFIMGRSAGSRNRVFEADGDGLRTRAFDESKLPDPSLYVYRAVRVLGNRTIVTNGDQTDTIYDGMAEGKTFSASLTVRAFEPDAPNFTPRISAVQRFDGAYNYSMSILKSIDAEGTDCARYTFDYPAKPGLGHFIHTYVTNGNPIPTFQGEPERVAMLDDIDEFTNRVWKNLNEDNKISLYVRYTDLETGAYDERLINKNK